MEANESNVESTVYVSNLPFSLTNNDLHQMFQKYGKVVKVTIVKDKQTRKSKGVAFIVFRSKNEALKCVQLTNQQQVFGRTLKSSIAIDNGRTEEFSTKKKTYPDKSRCFECGEEGHLSYECPKNALGSREQPKKAPIKRRRVKEEEDNGEQEDDSLGAAIRYEQQRRLAEESTSTAAPTKRKIIKKNAYFSDEEDVESD